MAWFVLNRQRNLLLTHNNFVLYAKETATFVAAKTAPKLIITKAGAAKIILSFLKWQKMVNGIVHAAAWEMCVLNAIGLWRNKEWFVAYVLVKYIRSALKYQCNSQ